jgi:uncharacterized protein YuzE
MKISYDPVDALSIVFRETTVTTRPLADGITGEYDRDGRLAGLEVLDAKKRFGDEETFQRIIIEELAYRKWFFAKSQTSHTALKVPGAFRAVTATV